jgi:peptidoglycan/LPS O-acetylase OafA/YrhL
VTAATTPDERWRLGYRPALDAIRAVAVLLVIFGHGDAPLIGGGAAVGVTMFFALSGFLITRLLLTERERTGKVSLRGFYMRRARRLLPALVPLVILAGVVLWIDRGPLASVVSVTATSLYFANWVHAAGIDMGPLAHTWSLAIEEQFYIVWPVTMLFGLALFGRRGLIAAMIVGAVGSVLVRAVLWDDVYRAYAGTDARADALLIGCTLALLSWTGRRWVAVPGALAVGAAMLLPTIPLTHTLAALGTAGLIYGLYDAPWRLRGLAGVGRISYGLYLWHYPIALLVEPWAVLPRLAVLFGGTFLVASLSYRYVELPFLRSPNRIRSNAERVGGGRGGHDAVILKPGAG